MNTTKVKLNEDLTINSAHDVTIQLLKSLNKADCIELDFSVLKKIDISGFQILVSFVKEALVSGKDIVFKGNFNDELKMDINSLTFDIRLFDSGLLDSGEEFLLYIKGII